MAIWQQIAIQISAATGQRFRPININNVSGGCINETVHLHDSQQHYFVKLNHIDQLAMFEAEAQGLISIQQSRSIKSPAVITLGCVEDRAFLVLEHLNMQSSIPRLGADQLGIQLAQMHRHTKQQFGWHQKNTLGTTTQPNHWQSSWLDFWREQRLGYQLQLAYRNGYSRLRQPGERLLNKLATILQDHRPEPSLLHGDLWSGNYAFADDVPVIFDPATYYGDRETDIAMTELFGGFSPEFYQAYNEAYPLKAGYEQRKTLYNLYHILNHVNLFGRGYLSQAEQMIETLLADY